MNESPISQYLLLFRGTDWSQQLAPDEVRKIMDDTYAWFDQLFREGKATAAQPLETGGQTISWKNGRVSDGPFVESKESIGGYVMLKADSFAEAMTIARGNPMIPHGLHVEVRPIAEECPVVKAAMRKAALADV